MSHAERTSLAASLAVLLLFAAPAARAAAQAGDEAARSVTAADPAMPAMLRLAVARSQAADVAPAYHLDRDGRGASPRHGVELAFTPRGARLDGPAGGFTLHLERFGRGDGRPVRRAAPHIDGAWVEYDRGLGLTEWFVNLPRGVEQGWTLARRPAGQGPLVLELDTARPPDRVDDGRLAWSGLVYHRLVALDADGRELSSVWSHDGARLRIEVDDRDAAYPVLIDPWVEQAKLTTEDGAAGDLFGISVALADDTALVGAPSADVNGNFNQGAAYVFTRSGNLWSQQDKLTADDGAVNNQFGFSVALAGDTALVGADLADVDGNTFPGAAYVFTRSGDNWSQQAKLTADDGGVSDQFGISLALAGDTALVGASSADVDVNFNQGAAYVFTRSDDLWSQQDKLTADDGAAGDQFGFSVALAGDTALVGAPVADVDGNSDQGAAYVFTRSGNLWSQQAKLTADDGGVSDQFGISLALAGDAALVAAYLADVNGNVDQGAAYTFTRSGDLWSQQNKLFADDGAGGDQFGASVALAGDTALVGASTADTDGNLNQGAAYVFLPPLTPAALAVDAEPLASNGNGVFEPGETVEMAPFWHNNGDDQAFADGILSSFAGPEGASYDIVSNGVGYVISPGESSSCQDSEGGCYELEIQLTGPARPAVHWEAIVEEELQTGPSEFVTHAWTLHVGDSFTDVLRTNLFYLSVETLLHSGITGGCVGTEFCPGGLSTRAQMPVFMLKALEGPDYVPPACVEGDEAFTDVPFDNPFCPWITGLFDRGVVAGCGGGDYCPGNPVNRAQMAVFLLRTLEGSEYTPPECMDAFDDVPCPSLFADWIEELSARGITSGCGGGNYCPGDSVSRAQMASFITKTFELTLYGP